MISACPAASDPNVADLPPLHPPPWCCDGPHESALFGAITRGLGSLWDFLKRSFGFGGAVAATPRVPTPPALPRGFGGPGFSDPSGSGFQLQGFTPPPAAAIQPVPVYLNLDGRRVGECLIQFMERGLSVPTASAARFNTRLALPPEFGAA